MSTSKLHIDLRQGQALVIGNTRIVLEHKSGQAARLCIEAPRDVKITRDGNTNHGAQECASSSMKELTNGKYPL